MPSLLAKLLYRLWFVVPRFALPDIEKSIRDQARIQRFKNNQRWLTSYHWPGTGHRRVLLVHGWSGRSTQFVEIIKALNFAGYHVHAIDFPAHGSSEGRTTNLYEMAEALEIFAESLGMLDAVVTHSLGGPVAALALRDNPIAKKMICISPPASMDRLFQHFVDLLSIPDKVTTHILSLAKQEFGKEIMRDLSLIENIKSLLCPGLIIHDEDDQDVSIADALELAQHWPQAELLKTTGLGHRRILRDPQVIDKLLEFIQN
ncbi:MAG: alpha/beta hydrolase [Proteobacteria bacterium]|nr:alpha/beta hydrolase [Pseudomonadota bacterium]